jgi:methyl-accepting chemotaxis protein
MHRRWRRQRRLRPLATKFFIFTATLMFWVVAVMFAYDLRADTFDASRALLLAVVIMLVAGATAQFTSRVLARPLARLSEGILAVQNGELEFIEVSPTRDEVQFLGESFNQMIQALAISQQEIARRTAELEAAIQRAQHATAAQNQFLDGLSRQLGAPLNEIAEILDQTAEAEPEDSLSLDELQAAHHSADTLMALLSQLRPETQPAALSPK